jgi:hypothetical protein
VCLLFFRAPGLKVVAYHGNSKREKERALARVQRRGGVCLTTYGLVVTSWEQIGQQDGREFVWVCVVKYCKILDS